MVHGGRVPADLLVGRWRRDEVVEIEVLGWQDGRTRLLGEVRWQAHPLVGRDALALTASFAHLPAASDEVQLALWGSGGGDEELRRRPDVLVFDAEDVVSGS